MSKYDRLLHLLNLLRSRHNLKASDLARECEVTERTIYRDIMSLSSANIPIYFDDGYKLLTDAFLPPLNFSLEEYLLLKLGLNSSPMSVNTPLGKSAKRVLAKIDASLSPEVKNRLGDLGDPLRINLKTTGDFSKLGLIFNLIEQSILNKRTVGLDYESLESGKSTRDVDPYALVFKRHSWYLLGFCHYRQETRTFRLNRIKKVTLTDRNFERKSDFSVEEFFRDSWEIYQGKLTEVKLRFLGKAAKVIESGPHHPSEIITKEKDGALLYSVKVKGTEEISRWILGFGEMVEVLEPVDFRENIKDTIQKMQKLYSG
ncbi:MAG: transcriptional regulator [candidate division Zixibacteria bacterium]|nr:transcriptional regulator [candidate division Zixibacteria bacterium]